MAKTAKAASTAGRRPPRRRAEQQRSLETRASILNAAIAEFAERGFEGASIRAIADRLGLQHPLITYHYRTKDILWRAAAEHAFAQIKAGWDISAPENSDLPPLARLREQYATLFRYTVAFPEFHRFMRQEALTNNPRLKWVARTVLAPLLGRLIPQIVAAQKQGLLPSVDPILFHYMMVSLTATLSGFGPEMLITSGTIRREYESNRSVLASGGRNGFWTTGVREAFCWQGSASGPVTTTPERKQRFDCKGHQRPQKCFPNLASFRQVDAEGEIVFSKKGESFQESQGILSPLRLPVPPRPLY